MTKLKAAGLSASTVDTVGKRLKHLDENAHLDSPETVKTFIASKPVANSYKHELAKAYHYYVTCQGMQWTRPKYRFENRVPQVPTGEQLSKIIGEAGPKYKVIFRLLAETGAMPVELERLNIQRDWNPAKGTITIQGCKGHAGRVLTLKPSLNEALCTYMLKYDKFPKAEVMGRTSKIPQQTQGPVSAEHACTVYLTTTRRVHILRMVFPHG